MDAVRRMVRKSRFFERENICAVTRLGGVCVRFGRKGAIDLYALQEVFLTALNHIVLTWFVHFFIPFYASEDFSSQFRPLGTVCRIMKRIRCLSLWRPMSTSSKEVKPAPVIGAHEGPGNGYRVSTPR